MSYQAQLFPFRFHRLGLDRHVAVSEAGDFVYLSQSELTQLIEAPNALPPERLAELKCKYFVGDPHSRAMTRLLASRMAQKKETILSGPSLHAIVPTLHCEHTCTYCQVSRSLTDQGNALSPVQIDRICETVFESPSQTLTIEFQGGDPLLRFDLVRHAIEKIAELNHTVQRNIRFIVSSTLHQLTAEMCEFFKSYPVFLSTSIDGPPALHNKQRQLRTQNAYECTVEGIGLARQILGPDSVSALMTTTRDTLEQPKAVVDEYVKLGFADIFIRPLSHYGFAKRNLKRLGYTPAEFLRFYKKAFERVLYWNRQGVAIREGSAALAFNKMLSPFDAGYVDMQSPTGAGLACLVYNYDGYIYPSDESRMLAETGDTSLRLGAIGDSLQSLLSGSVARQLVSTSFTQYVPGCRNCAFSTYCGPDPVEMKGEFGTVNAPVFWTNHCQRQMGLYEFLFKQLDRGERWLMDLAYSWAQPTE
ncbi:MAG: His-Xaa-Ser system radical SAM maturase HxsB [Candidatus Thiodiazotropha endolucinida]